MKLLPRCSHVLALLAWSLTGHAQVDMEAVLQAKAAFVERMVTVHGFDHDEISGIVDSAEIDEQILDTISAPAERVLAWHEYRSIFVNDARIRAGVGFWTRHAEAIAEASEAYGVAPEVLVAILGVETSYGRIMGSHRVIDALVTLAFAYPPRAAFFASELEAFFLLVREEGIDPQSVLGSYAGAMGAGQFISSSYRAYAVDGNGDGQRDLWGEWRDVLASVANYFSAHGWRRDEPVVDRAQLTQRRSGDEPPNSPDLDATVASLRDAGYAFSTQLPGETPATLLSLEGEDGQEYWVGYHNFYVITRYNRSVMYALAVHQLGQSLLAAYAPARSVSEAGQ
ncbi:MAG: lytic murein transglycosylase B [Rhodospirillaceae bacterium]|nr:lytic murein transglycosylase B [Rhodospirillaceae bacterium]